MSTDCTVQIEDQLRHTGEFIMTAGLPIIVGAMFWTFSLVVAVATVVVLCRKGLSRPRTALLVSIALMFLIATGIFTLAVCSFFYQTREIFLKGAFQGEDLTQIGKTVATVDAVNDVLMSMLLIPGDCIVIWRAYAVWTRSRMIMIIPVMFLLGCIGTFTIIMDEIFTNIRL
ncbi:hypothetical protein C8J56DRAFT_897563 [Mycena floridula]|nr:hypothetical protein C8J56DRAFT_897563 [Mycena floridula]